MAWTSKQIADLNGSMEAARLVALGTVVDALVTSDTAKTAQAIVRGSYTAVADDATANKMTIASGLAAIAGWQVQILRAGVDVTADAAMSVASTTNLQIADGSTYTTTAGDVVNYIIW